MWWEQWVTNRIIIAGIFVNVNFSYSTAQDSDVEYLQNNFAFFIFRWCTTIRNTEITRYTVLLSGTLCHFSCIRHHPGCFYCLWIPTGATAVRLAGFGRGTGPILLDNVQCAGDEDRLFDCPSNEIGLHNCGHREDAGVRCLPIPRKLLHFVCACVILCMCVDDLNKKL